MQSNYINLATLPTNELCDLIYTEHVKLVNAAATCEMSTSNGIEHDELIHDIFSLGVAVTTIFAIKQGKLPPERLAIPANTLRGMIRTLEFLRAQYEQEKATK